jgi:hypothetical protein
VSPSTPSRSPSCSTDRWHAAAIRGSGSTIYGTPTPRCFANDVAIKVVSERLGHAHPGFTIATYQHLLPGMGAGAATAFATLLTTARGERPDRTHRRRRVVIGRQSTDRQRQTTSSAGLRLVGPVDTIGR